MLLNNNKPSIETRYIAPHLKSFAQSELNKLDGFLKLEGARDDGELYCKIHYRRLIDENPNLIHSIVVRVPDEIRTSIQSEQNLKEFLRKSEKFDQLRCSAKAPAIKKPTINNIFLGDGNEFQKLIDAAFKYTAEQDADDAEYVKVTHFKNHLKSFNDTVNSDFFLYE